MTTIAFLSALLVIVSGTYIKRNFLPNLPTRTGKIVGGYPVEITEVPHQVSLQFNGAHCCGGSIIAGRWILTAAHCTDDYPYANGYLVRVGSSSHADGGLLVSVKEIFPHPNFDDVADLEFDFCLIELDATLEFNDTVRPIGLTQVEPDDGSMSLVSGWGGTRSFEESNELLRAVVVPVVNREECAQAYADIYEITESMICAGYCEEGGKDACDGDSGGPLVVNEMLAGVVSWGNDCALPGYPGVYSNVAAVRKWIKEVSGV